MRETVYAFIDNQNLYKGIKSLGWALDYKKFRIFLKNKFRVSKAFLFLGYIHRNKRLYRKLQELGYETVFKETVKTKNGYKGNIDAELVLHAAKIQFRDYQKGIFVSGDGDFKCLYLELLKDKKLGKILIPNQTSQSILLKEFQEYKIYLEFESWKIKWGTSKRNT